MARLVADSLARGNWVVIFAVSVISALLVEPVDLESGGMGVTFCDPK